LFKALIFPKGIGIIGFIIKNKKMFGRKKTTTKIDKLVT
jgi:hypothetical protein